MEISKQDREELELFKRRANTCRYSDKISINTKVNHLVDLCDRLSSIILSNETKGEYKKMDTKEIRDELRRLQDTIRELICRFERENNCDVKISCEDTKSIILSAIIKPTEGYQSLGFKSHDDI